MTYNFILTKHMRLKNKKGGIRMKVYVKPSFSIIQLQVEEGIACFGSYQGNHGGHQGGGYQGGGGHQGGGHQGGGGHHGGGH